MYLGNASISDNEFGCELLECESKASKEQDRAANVSLPSEIVSPRTSFHTKGTDYTTYTSTCKSLNANYSWYTVLDTQLFSFFVMHIYLLCGATDTTDSYSHSLRGAAMLLSMEEVLLAAELVLWLCAAWPVFWLWAGWFWPAWLWLWAGFCVWLGLVGGLEVSMLLPMLLPSCSRLMCRTTTVALNACWREEEEGKKWAWRVRGVSWMQLEPVSTLWASYIFSLFK